MNTVNGVSHSVIARQSLDDFDLGVYCIDQGALVIDPEAEPDATIPYKLEYDREGILINTENGNTYFEQSTIPEMSSSSKVASSRELAQALYTTI